MISKQSRSEALSALLDARMQHTRWVKEATNNPTPKIEIHHTRCGFGRWLTSVEGDLTELSEFIALDQPHKALHAAYKLLRITPEQEQRKQDILRLSAELITRIDALEKRLQKR